MLNHNEHEAGAGTQGLKRDTWGQRHGAVLLLSGFGLLLVALVMYEALSR